MQYFGSIFSVSDISPTNAHGWGFNFRRGSLASVIVKTIGIPHTSSRLRNRIVCNLIKSKKSIKSILDVGGGVGLTGFYLNQFGYKYTGLDISKYKIDIAVRLVRNSGVKNMKFLREDIMKIHFKEKFDCALCMEVLEHVKNPIQVIQKISEQVKNGGFIILSFPSSHYINGLAKNYFSHVRVGIEPEEIESSLNSSDLKVNDVLTFGNTFIAKILFLVDFYLIKYVPILAGLHFFLFYPLAVFDQKFFQSKNPLGYIVVLKKKKL